ncbi:MbcA/ParS/Xre antitoxin family protein [Rhodospirillum sp. A1_3_36]|uniref:MbcA/ParS/Xre antitoxin family protein n=1 Tax=Rhodospirillum sp. A1_3_36 TaxID=3391666 RepID=UPI0039A41A99
MLLPDDRASDTWIKRPNDAPLFGGRPAIERMLSGQVSDLFVVRQYLDAQRGGWA